LKEEGQQVPAARGEVLLHNLDLERLVPVGAGGPTPMIAP
jgi:hypothetical protein